MRRLDLSIGQRLAIGFGILLLLLASGFGYLYLVQKESSEAQALFEEKIAPRTELANQLQRAILYTGINARSFLLAPTDEALERVQANMVEARESLQALAGAPMDARDEELIGTLRPLVDGYLQAVSRIIEVHGTTPIEAEQEQKLANSREAALVALHRFHSVANCETERRSRRHGQCTGASA